ncbi:MAG TPA: EAL domain-containing protein [Gallionella sp.]|nr:EAL domain-containing protein [Gallionella sp.]
MEREDILPILYDMAVVIGGEITLNSLLSRTLQRLLYYTSFPAGFICLDLPSAEKISPDGMLSVRLDAVVGDFELLGLLGKQVELPCALLCGDAVRETEKPALLAGLPGKAERYRSYLRLPIDGYGVIILLATHIPETKLPLTLIFQPVMAHLAKAILLCRSYDAYTSSLVAERNLMGEVFENSASGVLIADADNNIVAVNASFSRITGYTAEDAIGKNPSMLASGRHNRDFYAAMWQTFLTGGYWQGEIWNRRKNGDVYPEWLNISLVKDKAGHVTNYVGMFSDISELKAAQEKIEYLAHHDALTGLPNQVLLRDRFRQALAQAARSGEMVALLLIDLDNFKVVNETLGHPAGDQLLKLVAQRLVASVRETDTVSRQGGDEFVIVLNGNLNEATIAHTAQNILDRMLELESVAGHDLSTSASIGISLYPVDGDEFDELLKQADTALYHAKDAGRATYRFFTESMNTAMQARFDMDNRLRYALDRGEFVLYYQPQVDIATQRIVGAEALIRWNSPEMGMVPPGKFIPLVEDSGMIVPIGAWVLSEACRQFAAWQQAGLPIGTVAVNLSAVQFKRANLVETVAQALRDSGLSAACLELELTESILIHDTEATLDTVRQLKALGVHLSLDDFGTGYSSLSYLQRFAVDKLKIDQSFVRELGMNAETETIVNTMIGLGKGLKLQTIAEGVETSQQASILQGFGCDQIQGYFYGRPLPVDEFLRLFNTDGYIRK